MNTPAAQSLDASRFTTLPPAPSGVGREILTLTEYDFFLLDVRRVVLLPNRVWHATSEAQAADLLLSTPCAVAIVDINLLTLQTAPVIARLAQQFPDLSFVVTGDSAGRGARATGWDAAPAGRLRNYPSRPAPAARGW